MMIFGGVGAGGPDWGLGSGGRRGNGREPDGTGGWGQECQMAGEGGDVRAGGSDGSCWSGGAGGPDDMGGGAGG